MLNNSLAWNRIYNPLINIQINGTRAIEGNFRYKNILSNGSTFFDSLFADKVEFMGTFESLYPVAEQKKVKVRYLQGEGDLNFTNCIVDIDVLIMNGRVNFQNCSGRIGKIYGSFETNDTCDIAFGECYLSSPTYFKGNCSADIIVTQNSYLELTNTCSVKNLYSYQTSVSIEDFSKVTEDLWLESGSLFYSSTNTIGPDTIHIGNCYFEYSGKIEELNIEGFQPSDISLTNGTTVKSITTLGHVSLADDTIVTNLNADSVAFENSSEDIVKNVTVTGITRVLYAGPPNSIPIAGNFTVDELHEVVYDFGIPDIDSKQNILIPYELEILDLEPLYQSRTGNRESNFIYSKEPSRTPLIPTDLLSGLSAFSVTSTRTAFENTHDIAIVLTAGQVLEFGTVNLPNATASGYVILRLYNETNQVATNDGLNDLDSYIHYTVPRSGTYVMKIGGYRSNSVSGTVAWRVS